jgi:tetratricopeptide (TPR) repeat protein
MGNKVGTEPELDDEVPKILMLGERACGKSSLFQYLSLTAQLDRVKFREEQKKKIPPIMVAACFPIASEYCKKNAEYLNPGILKTMGKYDNCLMLSRRGGDTIVSLTPEMGSALKKLNSEKEFREYVLNYQFSTVRIESLANKDAILYFLDNLDRIFSVFYTPSDEDLRMLCLEAKSKTKGTFQIERFEFLLESHKYDTIQQIGNESIELSKQKQIRAVFCLMSLSDLYQNLVVDTGGATQNSLEFFHSIVNTHFVELSEIPVFLIFTKDDVFETIFDSTKLASTFPEFHGSTANEGRDFFKHMCWKGLYRAHHQVFVHFLNASDQESCKNFFLQVYERIGNPKPKEATSFSSLGYWLKRLRKYEQSLKAFEKSLQLEKNNSFAHAGKAKVLMELGKSKEAFQEFQKSTAIDPHHADTYSYQGIILNLLGRHDEAVLSFEMSLSIEPRYPLNFSLEAQSFNQIGRFVDAISSAKKALALNPGNFDASVQMLEALISLKKFDKVLEVCEKIILSDKRNAFNYYYKGTALRLLQRTSEAMEAYRMAQRLDPRILNGESMLWFNYQRALDFHRNCAFQECLQVLRLNLRLYPNHILSLELKVRCALQLDEFGSLWKCGALLKAHFFSRTQTDDITPTEKQMIEKTLKRYGQLHKMKFGL